MIFKSKWNILYLTICLLSLLILTSKTSFAEASIVENISPGVIREEHIVKYNGKNTVVNLLKCDLNNPYLNISVVAGGGKYTNRATVSSMADRTNATALVNGDFFNTLLQGSPEGPSIVDGKLQTSPVEYIGLYSLGISKDNVAYIEEIDFSGKVTAPNNKTYKIDGLNKSYYWYEPTNEYSHQDKIQLYNDFWSSKSRGDKKNTEVLVNSNGVVEQISENKSFDFSVPDGKIIMQVDGKAYDFIKSNVKIGDKLKIDYSISPNRNFKFLVGGHALLVDKGKEVKYTKDINVLGGVRARTAAGISSDGKTLYIASAEGRTKRSAGLSLSQLSNFMVSIGSNKALNLDGGGSTTMVLKNLGENNRTRVINPEKNNAERKVVNGIGFYNTAPDSNVLAGIKIKGPDTMVVGQSAEFALAGAWNEFLKPLSIENIKFTPSSADPESGQWGGNYFLATKEGLTNINIVTDSGIFASKPVTVQGFDYISSLDLKANKNKVKENDTVTISTKALLKNKNKIDLSPKVLSFTIEGFQGNFDKMGNLVIESLNGNSSGKITVKAGNIEKSLDIFDINSKFLKMNIGKKVYYIDELKKEMDTAPFIQDDRTLVPLRFIVEALGGQVSYNDEKREVSIDYKDKNLKLTIGEDKLYVNDQEVKMDTVSIIKDNRTFIPIRFVAESLDMKIFYNDSNKEISIIDKK